MHTHRDITLQRLQRFAGDDQLRARLYPDRRPVALSAYAAPDRIPFDQATRADYSPIDVGHRFGPAWSTHWVRVDVTIPEAWAGKEVHLRWDSASEACVWQDGEPMQGFAGSEFFFPPRREFVVTRAARGGEHFGLYIEVACNAYFGVHPFHAPEDIGTLKIAEVAVFDREAWDLLWDFVVVADMARHLPADTPRAGQALYAANAMVNACDLDDRRTWARARDIARGFLAARNGDGQHNLSLVGHAHIDTAWLWPLAETRRKCVRTFSTAVRMMDENPAYVFACSQAQQFEWIRDGQPGLYARIQRHAQRGAFVPTGGTWIEPDCNIPSGESLVRQFLFGQRFFEREFGARCAEFWNPDVFGYSGQLPQIIRGAGMCYFLTQKLSWNAFNKPAHHTFLWEGIDGTRVLTHFPPADTYNALASVEQVLFNVRNYKDHDRSRESYMLFGHGDGGGGPTPDMLERIMRMADVDGLPRAAMRPPAEFFERLDRDMKSPEVWVGELYFELHRGTYTSQARNKLANRRSEALLHDAELLAVVAGAGYPVDELTGLWKRVLVNQFHDIIPGSSIGEVYADSARDYADILQSADALRERALGALGARDHGHSVMAVNTLGHPRREVMALPPGAAAVQTGADGRGLGVASVPSMGYAVFDPADAPAERVQVDESQVAIKIENDWVRAVLTRDGTLASLYDKRAKREAIAAGGFANRFVLFDDQPLKWDAWDVDVFHLEKRFEVPPATSMRVIERGPLRAAVAFDYAISARSTLTQVVSLDAVSPALTFDTSVDWHERHKFLKVEFPTDIRAPNATYEIQFGHVQRPTHFNTSWDLARFEVPAQRWADLSELDFGLAVLNDCKYGYAVHGNVMRLSLLRAPTFPDPEADQGEHRFRYAVLPHLGLRDLSDVVQRAAAFNTPLLVRWTSLERGSRSWFSIDNDALVIDTVKRAEDGDGVIVRLYEATGGRRTATLSGLRPIAAAHRCNLLEDVEAPLFVDDGAVHIDARPFEIITLRLAMAA